MFKPITNPYIVGNPIKTKKMFYGREDDFEFIRKKLESAKKSYIIVLSGERRSGKTSILFQILNGELGDNFIPILIDMQTMAGLKNESEFFEKFAQETIKYLGDRFVLQNYDFHSAQESPYKVFTKLLNDIHTVFPYKNKLFLIDEYELIELKCSEGSLSNSFVPFLSGILESERRISFIFTGSKTLEERGTTFWQNLFSKSLFRNVSFLSQPDTIRLITQPVEGKITFSERVLDSIYRFTSGQPFYTQIVGQHIVDFVNEHEKKHIAEAELEHIVNDILENPLPQMIYFWNNLPDSQKLLLSLLAEVLDGANSYVSAAEIDKRTRKKKLGVHLDTHLMNTVLEALYHRKYVGKSGESYCFQIDLMRQWIKRDHSIWRVLKEVNLDSISMEEGLPSTAGRSEILKPGSTKKKKWILPAAAVVIIGLVMGGWLLSNKATNPSRSTQSLSSNPTTMTQKEEISTSAPTPPLVTEKNQNEKSTEKPIANQSLDTEKNRPKTTSAEQHKVESTNPETVDPVAEKLESLRSVMLQSKSEAVKSDAATLAGATFDKGVNAESDAETYAANKDYENALTQLQQAHDYFDQANQESRVSAQQAKNQTSDLLQQIGKIQSQLKPEHRLLTEFRNAESSRIKGNEQADQGDYSLANKSYSAAIDLYNSAIQIRLDDTQKIKTAIQGYARALENKNITGSSFILNSYKKELENEWKPFFNVAQNIKIDLQTHTIEFTESTASVITDVLLQYSGAGGSGTKNIWKFEFIESGSDWLISKINEAK